MGWCVRTVFLFSLLMFLCSLYRRVQWLQCASQLWIVGQTSLSLAVSSFICIFISVINVSIVRHHEWNFKVKFSDCVEKILIKLQTYIK